MSAWQAAGATMATAATMSQNLGSSILDVTSADAANDTLPLPLRALRFTVSTERLLLRKVPAFLFRLSGLQTLVCVVSDALGMPAPLARATGVHGAGGAAAAAGPQTWKSALLEAVELGNIRSLGGMLNFLFSRWAFACLAMVCRMQFFT
jgi:hypothetical protein